VLENAVDVPAHRRSSPTVAVPALSPAVPEPAILAAVLEPAVDVPAHRRSSPTVPVPALLAAVPEPAAYVVGIYPLIILIGYVIVTGGILCSDESEVYLTICVEVWQTFNLRPLRLGEEKR